MVWEQREEVWEKSIRHRVFAAASDRLVQIRGGWKYLWRADRAHVLSCNPAQPTSVISSLRGNKSRIPETERAAACSGILLQQLWLIKSRLRTGSTPSINPSEARTELLTFPDELGSEFTLPRTKFLPGGIETGNHLL